MEGRRGKKPRMSPEPSSTAGYRLPPEIVLHEILPWLPVRRLLKFRRVCRDWRNFISAGNHRLAIQQFQRNIHRHPDTSIGGIYGFSDISGNNQNKLIYRSFFDNTLTVLCPSTRLNVKVKVAFTNGLCCLLCIHNTKNSNNAPPFAYIFNPFMKKNGVRVPLIHGEHDSSFVPYFWKTGKTTRTLGFAFDPMASIHDDDYIYRLVQFDWFCSDNRPEVPNGFKWEVRFLVYSSNSKIWVKSGYRMPSIVVDPCFTRIWPVFYAGGGKIYWHSQCFLVQYDLERDVATCMAMPETPEMPELPVHERRAVLQNLNVVRGGRLICTRLLRSCLEVWALDEKQWECMSKVEYHAIVDMGLRMERPIGLKDNTNVNWWHKGACIYEDEENGRRRMYLKFYFTCFRHHFLGALDYDLEKKRVIRRHVKGRFIRKVPPSRSWMVLVLGPVFTIHHTMLGVPT